MHPYAGIGDGRLDVDDVTIGEVRLELRVGDIAAQDDLDAVVNAANAQLRTGGGVAGALHAAAGPGLAQECAPLAPIEPGEVVITGGHDLPNPYVLHALGPVYGRDQPSDELLAACYRNALRSADEHELASVGFPALSTGAFGYPADEAASIAVATVADEATRLAHVRLVRFLLFSERDLAVLRGALEEQLRG
jgi:O-acetyl-ADP-ribose deacetylase